MTPFLFPSKPVQTYRLESIPITFRAQVKKDGHRVLIHCDKDGTVEFFNRRGTTLKTMTDPGKWEFVRDVLPKPFILDGEYVGPRQASAPHDLIYVWDAPIVGGKKLYRNQSYGTRYNILLAVAGERTARTGCLKLMEHEGLSLCLAETFTLGKEHTAWTRTQLPTLDALEDEGFVFKDFNDLMRWSIHRTEDIGTQIKLKV